MLRPPRLLVTDLDGTLLGDRGSLAHLCEMLNREGAPKLVFATGRQHDSATALLHEWRVSCGDYLIAGVGSEIYEREDEAWRALPWPAVDARWDAERIRSLLADLPLEAQPVRSPVKISYVASLDLAAIVRERLRAERIEASVIHSHGALLDVLPPGVDKGSAVAWLAARLHVDPSHVMTCGDTENDLAMLALPCPSIIVSNALTSLRVAAASMHRVYIASRPHAAGILEGLFRYGWLTASGWVTS